MIIVGLVIQMHLITFEYGLILYYIILYVSGMSAVSEEPKHGDSLQHAAAEDRGRHKLVHTAAVRGVLWNPA